MSDRAEFHVRGQPLDGTPLHYTASGLDYVYLSNGFTVEDDPDYGRIVTIENVDDLHCAIGLHIIQKKRGLTGAEFRFLRKQMKLKQKELAHGWGMDEQTVANYEKGKTIPTASDHLMRLEFALWMMPPDTRAEVLKELAAALRHERRRRGGEHSSTRPAMPLGILKQWQESIACPA